MSWRRVAALGVFYLHAEWRIRPLVAPNMPSATSRQRWLWFGALAILAASSSWPFHDLAEQVFFSLHMIEHMLVALVIPPLMLMGTPRWMAEHLVHSPRVLAVLFRLCRPLPAFFLFHLSLAGLHWRPIVEAMVASNVFHFLAHFWLFGIAVLVWLPVVSPTPLDSPPEPALADVCPFPAFHYPYRSSFFLDVQPHAVVSLLCRFGGPLRDFERYRSAGGGVDNETGRRLDPVGNDCGDLVQMDRRRAGQGFNRAPPAPLPRPGSRKLRGPRPPDDPPPPPGERRPLLLRLLRLIGPWAALLIVLVAVAALLVVRQSFPQVEGEMVVPGLAGEATVIRDATGHRTFTHPPFRTW